VISLAGQPERQPDLKKPMARDKKGKPKSMETMARQLEGERMDGTGNEAIFSLFFLEHKKKTTPFQFAPHFSPQF
jgi:hypothetical protein